MIHVKIPATSANVGSGFDSVGFALKLYNEIWVEEAPAGVLEIESLGGDKNVPKDENNLIYSTIADFFRNERKELPGLRIKQKDNIPFTRGLGSSAACIAGGLLIANKLAGTNYSKKELAVMAARKEGHPDNTNPAIFGGVVSGAMTEGSMVYVKMNMPEKLIYAVMVPDYYVSTQKARAVLPTDVPLRDAVFNCQRAALLTASIATGRFDNLRVAVDDRLHQPYRKELIPGLYSIFDESYHKGALATFLSGAGPTIISLLEKKDMESFDKGMKIFFEHAYGNWKIDYIAPDNDGAQIL